MSPQDDAKMRRSVMSVDLMHECHQPALSDGAFTNKRCCRGNIVTIWFCIRTSFTFKMTQNAVVVQGAGESKWDDVNSLKSGSGQSCE